jgi:hypothetical protein
MPIDMKRYPPDWKQISASVREHAGHKCEFCGVPNHAIGYRDRRGVFHEVTPDDVSFYEALWHIKVIKIVTTVAHLDHDTTNNDPANLRELCQRCHLRYDLKHHLRNASHTRAVKRAGLTIPFQF